MTTTAIANRMFQLYQSNKHSIAFRELYDNNILSIVNNGETVTKTIGKGNLLEKLKIFRKAIEKVHGHTITEPIVTDNYFMVTMQVDVTMKGKLRKQVKEVGVYEVAEGKIIKEEFFRALLIKTIDMKFRF